MNAVAVQHARTQPFDLQERTPKRLAELARTAKLNLSQYVKCLVIMAHDELLLGRPNKNRAFVPRLLQLAAQRTHAPKAARVGIALDAQHVDVIRKLQETLGLRRRDLVVDYAVQAMWELCPPDDGGGGVDDDEDPLERSRRLASYHNVENLRASTDGGARLISLVLPHLQLEEVKPKKV